MNRRLAKQKLLLAVSAVFLLAPPGAWAHGVAGKRFFPTTLATEDPAVSDEFSILGTHIKEPAADEDPATWSTDLSADYTKRITPHFGISFAGEYTHLDPDAGRNRDGFGNLEIGAKYQFLTSEAHEAIMSIALEAEIGDTGDSDVGADSFSTITPTLFFGKGMGDLPDSARYLKPLAVTGLLGVSVPTDSRSETLTDDGERLVEEHPTTAIWGFAVEYNLQYLQSVVRDVGLKAPFNRMIPLVEFAMVTCLDRGCDGETTATANPGIIWFGKHMQLGVEAVLPLNERTGKEAGVLVQLHLFMDDLLPATLGRPLLAEGSARPARWNQDSR